jgi:hypothetical protein
MDRNLGLGQSRSPPLAESSGCPPLWSEGAAPSNFGRPRGVAYGLQLNFPEPEDYQTYLSKNDHAQILRTTPGVSAGNVETFKNFCGVKSTTVLVNWFNLIRAAVISADGIIPRITNCLWSRDTGTP